MAVKIVELQVVIIVDEAEILPTCRFEPRNIRVGQGHACIQAAAVAIVFKTGVILPNHAVLSIFLTRTNHPQLFPGPHIT